MDELRYCEKCEYALPRIFCAAKTEKNLFTGVWNFEDLRKRTDANNDGDCPDYKEKVK